MGSIVIKLSPYKLKNPDLDLRYLIPDRISDLTGQKISDDGYDYLDDEENTMAIFLKSAIPSEDVKTVLEILKSETFLDNDIYETSIIAICDNNDYELDKYTAVHP
jgi:hypothetical protein